MKQGGKREEESKSKSNGGRMSKSRTQDRSKASKASTCVSVKKNNWRRQKESTDEPEVLGRLAEMRTGRGSSGLVGGREEQERQRKGNGGKGEHEGKGGRLNREGKQQETRGGGGGR